MDGRSAANAAATATSNDERECEPASEATNNVQHAARTAESPVYGHVSTAVKESLKNELISVSYYINRYRCFLLDFFL